MRVYVLEFASAGAFARAFERLMDADPVESCLAEPERARLRFRAPAGRADALVKRIYAEGGLAWCSRHDVLRRA